MWFVVFVIGFGIVVVVVVGVLFFVCLLFGWYKKIDVEIYNEYNKKKVII